METRLQEAMPKFFTGLWKDAKNRIYRFVRGKRVAKGEVAKAPAAKTTTALVPAAKPQYPVAKGVKPPPGKAVAGLKPKARVFQRGEPKKPFVKPEREKAPEGHIPPSKLPKGKKPKTVVKYDPKAHMSKEDMGDIGRKLNIKSWALRKVTERDLNTLERIALKVTDERQKVALHDLKQVYTYAKANDTPAFVATFTPKAAPLKKDPQALKSYSPISHRSPMNQKTDRERNTADAIARMVTHVQGNPTKEQWNTLADGWSKLHPDVRHQVLRKIDAERFGVPDPKSTEFSTTAEYNKAVKKWHKDKRAHEVAEIRKFAEKGHKEVTDVAKGRDFRASQNHVRGRKFFKND